jgi:putative DNA primase/helicase
MKEKRFEAEDEKARACAAHLATEWRYDHAAGAWYHYDGSIWRRCERGEGTAAVREFIRASIQPYEDLDTTMMQSARYIRAVESLAIIDHRIRAHANDWDRDAYVCGAPSVHVDLVAEMEPTPERMITRSIAANPRHDAPTRWIQYLHQATGGDGDLAEYLQRLAGYCMTASTREQTFWFIYGQGGSGKSVFLDTLRSAMGTYAVSVPAEFFEQRHSDQHPEELARLQGVRLVTASETRAGRAWNEVRIKQLTGDGTVTARFMRQNSFDFEPHAKIIIAGNHRPSLRVVDAAIRRRMRVIPFVHPPARPDPTLLAKLQAEMPQIVGWMMEGAGKWQTSGLPMPEAVARETAAYLDGQDVIGSWLDDSTRKLPGAFTSIGALYESFAEYSRAAGEMHPVNARTLGEQLEMRGYARKRTSSERGFADLMIEPREVESEGRRGWR